MGAANWFGWNARMDLCWIWNAVASRESTTSMCAYLVVVQGRFVGARRQELGLGASINASYPICYGAINRANHKC
jgi:hypothetical protein